MLLTEARRAARGTAGRRPGAAGRPGPRALGPRADRRGAGAGAAAACGATGPGPYQIQAAINAVHSDAATAADTDWGQIVRALRPAAGRGADPGRGAQPRGRGGRGGRPGRRAGAGRRAGPGPAPSCSTPCGPTCCGAARARGRRGGAGLRRRDRAGRQRRPRTGLPRAPRRDRMVARAFAGSRPVPSETLLQTAGTSRRTAARLATRTAAFPPTLPRRCPTAPAGAPPPLAQRGDAASRSGAGRLRRSVRLGRRHARCRRVAGAHWLPAAGRSPLPGHRQEPGRRTGRPSTSSSG